MVRLTERGEFTYVEMLVVAVVFSLVIGAMFVLSQTGNQMWVHTDDSLANVTSAQIAMDRITEDLRQASSSAGLTCASDNLQFTVGANRITYSRSGTELHKQVGAAPAMTVAGSVTSFTPTCQSNNVVRLQLTAQVSSLRPTLQKTLESQVWVQNP